MTRWIERSFFLISLGCFGCGVDVIAEPEQNESSATSYSSRSVLTSLQACKRAVAKRATELGDDSASFACPGYGGYSLERQYRELRDNVVLHLSDGRAVDLRLPGFLSHANHLGAEAEWRVGRDGAPHALILHIAETVVEGGERDLAIVVGLTGPTPCVTDILDSSLHPSQNHALARIAADAILWRASACPGEVTPR